MSDTKCFGHYCQEKESCKKCEYHIACQLVEKTERKLDQPLGGQDFDEISEFDEHLMVDAEVYRKINETNIRHCNGCEEGECSCEKQDLAEFLNFLFHLDNYTLGILAEIVAPSQDSSSRLTVAKMARTHGISRQGMHRKILDIARKSPELSSLLKCVILKIRKSRTDFRKGPCRKRKKQPAAN